MPIGLSRKCDVFSALRNSLPSRFPRCPAVFAGEVVASQSWRKRNRIRGGHMKKQAWTSLIAATACTLAIGVSAQTTAQTPPTQRPSSTTASDRITVTGCLQKDTASATAGTTGTSGTASASTSASAFVLNVTPPSPSTTGSTASTAGTSGSTASSYKLDADDSKLSPHVGHKVEITGSLDKSASTAPSGSASTAAGSTASASSSMAPKLKVDSVRMIAASCSN
jgi:hypothetical protein